MSRRDRWAEAKAFGLFIGDPDSNPALTRARDAAEKRAESNPGVLWSLIGPAKELIFQSTGEDAPRFTVVGPTLNARYMDLEMSASFDILSLETDDDVKEILALALVHDVPVYPNDAESAVELARLHQDLLTNGFVSHIDGKPTRLRPG